QLILNTTSLKLAQTAAAVLLVDQKVGKAPTSEVQQIVSRLQSGKFRLAFNDGVTSELNYNATSTDVQTALTALITDGTSNPVTVTGAGTAASPWIVTFAAKKNMPAIKGFSADDLSQHIPGFTGTLRNITGVDYGWGFNAFLGSDAVIDSVIEQASTGSANVSQQVLKGLMGGDTFTVTGGQTLWDFIVDNTVGKIDFNPNSPIGQMLEKWESLQEENSVKGVLAKTGNFLAQTVIEETTGLLKDQLNHQLGSLLETPFNPGIHVLAGLSGGDTYKFSGFWGIGVVAEIPGVSLVGDVVNGHDTLDFSEVESDMTFDIWSVTTQNKEELAAMFADAKGAVAGTPSIASDLFEVGTNFIIARDSTIKDLPGISDYLQDTPFFEAVTGSAVFATDIENIVGGQGENEFILHDGATLPGTITAEGDVKLNYSDYNTIVATRERQDVNLQAATGGTFKLSIDSPSSPGTPLETASITLATSGSNVDYATTASNIQAALNAGGVLGANAVTVTADHTNPNVYRVVFAATQNFAEMTISATTLTDKDAFTVNGAVSTFADGGTDTGIMVDASTGNLEIIPEVTIPLLGTLQSVEWNFGQAQGIDGYRFGALGEVLGDLGITDNLFRKYAVANITAVVGSSRNDNLTGNGNDNVFDLSEGGTDNVVGGDGDNLVVFTDSEDGVIVDLRLPGVFELQAADAKKNENQIQRVDLGQVTSGDFTLTFQDPTSTTPVFLTTQAITVVADADVMA
ncbi:MAG: hypothetical protein KDB23_27745, partial [Planctomycetales bacterium]|nr:hypothetical protein [Planctomycetales bacterium]